MTPQAKAVLMRIWIPVSGLTMRYKGKEPLDAKPNG
jgi:hypothetical protein